MTSREVFDTVKAHLLAQGEKSAVGTDCRYRDPEGRKCAIGCLVKDDLYNEALEGKNVLSESVLLALRGSGVAFEPGLLLALQTTHDHFPPEDWPEQLAEIEERYFLSVHT